MPGADPALPIAPMTGAALYTTYRFHWSYGHSARNLILWHRACRSSHASPQLAPTGMIAAPVGCHLLQSCQAVGHDQADAVPKIADAHSACLQLCAGSALRGPFGDHGNGPFGHSFLNKVVAIVLCAW